MPESTTASTTYLTGTPTPTAASGAAIRYDQAEVADVLEGLDENLGEFWRTRGRIVRVAFDGRQDLVESVAVAIGVDAEPHADERPDEGRALEGVWVTVPEGWGSLDVAGYIREQITPTSTTTTTPAAAPSTSTAASEPTPQEQAQERFQEFDHARDAALVAQRAKPRELNRVQKLNAYLQGILAQDNSGFREQFNQLAGNLGRTAWVAPQDMDDYAVGFLKGFFVDGAWGNVEGLWGMVKWGAWLSWNYNPLMLQHRILWGDDFAKEREFVRKGAHVAEIVYQITQVVGTKLGEEAFAQYDALKRGNAEDLRQLGEKHQKFAAAMLGLGVKLSEKVADPATRGRIAGAITWEIAQTAAEILLTAGVSKIATGGAKFAHIADKLADFGKYSDKFGDVAKQIAKWFDEGGELRKLLTKLDEAVDGIRNGTRAAREVFEVAREAMCFARDTLVATDSGLKLIGEVCVGDSVRAFDFRTGQWILAEVIQRHDNVYRGPVVTVQIGEACVETTLHHPFWVVDACGLDQRPVPRALARGEDEGPVLAGRWVDSHELRAGDFLIGQDGKKLRVDRVEQRYEETFPVSNLSVKDQHTFAVGSAGVLVHNTGWCDILEANAGQPRPRGLLRELAKLHKAGETKAGIHAHHIVLKSEYLGKPELKKWNDLSKDILDKHDIDKLTDMGKAETAVTKGKRPHNLTWAINWDHTEDYVESVYWYLKQADDKRGAKGVKDALDKIAERLGEGKKFRYDRFTGEVL